MDSLGRELTLDEIHSHILDIADYIHIICEKYNIRYVLGYGTLLGAIRHKGFIPWDDDFDIQMPRPDFDKFCQIMMTEENDHYKLICRANTDGYVYGIPRVIDNRFVYESTVKNHDRIKNPEMGIFVDIYPFDNFGNDKNCAHKLTKIMRKKNTLYSVYINKFSTRSLLNSMIKVPLHYLLRIIYGSHYNQRIDNDIFQIIKRYTHDSDMYVGQVTWEVGENQFEKEWFSERILMQFEDREYWVPKGYHHILKKSYNDYMKLPPEEKRHPTHYYKIFLKKSNGGN